MNQLKAILVTAPTRLRDQLTGLTTTRLIDACLQLPVTDQLTLDNTVRPLAARWRHLHAETRRAHQLLSQLVTAHAPRLLAEHGVGPDTAAALLSTAGDNPDRAPLNCDGDRQADAALHRIALVRLATHPQTKTYMTARRTPNRSNSMHPLRCLKRTLTRNLYAHLLQALNHRQPAPTTS